MKIKTRLVIVLFSIFLLACSLLVIERWRTPKWIVSDSFSLYEVGFDTYDLFDLGIARIDKDQYLDLYTVNHSARQIFRLGDKRIGYMHDVGMGQDRSIPGMDASESVAEYSSPGIYLSRVKKNLIIDVFGSPDLSYPVEMTLELNWPLEVVSQKKAEVEIINGNEQSGVAYGANIKLFRDASVAIRGNQDIVELPHKITLKEEQARMYFKLGTGFVTPASLEFSALWRDRHSMAWHDFNSDGINDVFIGRGGVKGQLQRVRKFGGVIEDELLIRGVNDAQDISAEVGFRKGDCPGRQAAWVDINVDGLLDLHASCGRVAGGHHPDLVYIRNIDGRFVESAESLGLGNPSVSVFKWLDVDADNDPDLLIYNGQDIVLERQRDGEFEPEVLVQNISEKPTQIALGDINGDLLLDAVVVLSRNSILLVGDGLGFDVGDMSSLGLPTTLRALQFADINLDGHLDAHAVPGGLYLSNGKNFSRFEGFVDETDIKLLSDAICNWYDLDIDGFMDVICGYRRFPRREIRAYKKLREGVSNYRYWSLHAGEFIEKDNANWVQFDLVGFSGNREAIGAYVTLTSDGVTQRRYVGQFDGAHYGQGHYRLYFGLGGAHSIESASVTWPDGEVQELLDLRVNELNIIDRSLL